MSDLIDRQAAIDGADAIITRDTSGNNDVVKAMTAWKRYVEALPTVEGRKKGKWIELEPKGVWTSVYHCSECGGAVMSCKVDLPNYCGHCGADMRGDADETD